MVRRMASFKLADIPEGERGPYEEALEELLRDTDVVVYTRQLTGAVTRSVA